MESLRTIWQLLREIGRNSARNAEATGVTRAVCIEAGALRRAALP